mmetsp:Transcript_5517/g.20848  ORF Transcript_5517/g.20848 Transcript_5517/m.20848 type:complete len:207 (-) Transcript_5517:4-624(-)
MACVYGIVTVLLTLIDSNRFRSASSFTATNTYRSPGGPPFRPALPSPLTRKRDPESTPAGTRSEIRLDRRTRPSPPQDSQGVNVCPEPPHCWHAVTCWKLPSGVRTVATTWPCPPHVPQDAGRVPAFTPLPVHESHSSSRTQSNSFSHPKTASRNSICRSYRSSSPWVGRLRWALPPCCCPMPPIPPPKKDSNKSNGLLNGSPYWS